MRDSFQARSARGSRTARRCSRLVGAWSTGFGGKPNKLTGTCS